MDRPKQQQSALRDRIVAGTCLAIMEGGQRPTVKSVLRRAKMRGEIFYEVFDGLEDCLKGALSHSLEEVFRCIEAEEDWSAWLASHRPEAAVIAWGFAIDAGLLEAAIDRAADLLPMDKTTAIGVVGGICTTAGARLRAGLSLDAATVGALEDFVDRYRM